MQCLWTFWPVCFRLCRLHIAANHFPMTEVFCLKWFHKYVSHLTGSHYSISFITVWELTCRHLKLTWVNLINHSMCHVCFYYYCPSHAIIAGSCNCNCRLILKGVDGFTTQQWCHFDNNNSRHNDGSPVNIQYKMIFHPDTNSSMLTCSPYFSRLWSLPCSQFANVISFHRCLVTKYCKNEYSDLMMALEGKGRTDITKLSSCVEDMTSLPNFEAIHPIVVDMFHSQL